MTKFWKKAIIIWLSIGTFIGSVPLAFSVIIKGGRDEGALFIGTLILMLVYISASAAYGIQRVNNSE